MFKKFVSLFARKSKTRDLREAFERMSKVMSEFDETVVYIYGTDWDREILKQPSMIPGHTPSPEEIHFMNKAAFFLSSARDEIQIAMRSKYDGQR